MKAIKYNLYETIVITRVGDVEISRGYEYYISNAPISADDKPILEDLASKIQNPERYDGQLSTVSCVIEIKNAYIRLRIRDDFDVCSPIWIYDYFDDKAAKFARKEFGKNWQLTHAVQCFQLRL